jgi:hypothetical protein
MSVDVENVETTTHHTPIIYCLGPLPDKDEANFSQNQLSSGENAKWNPIP